MEWLWANLPWMLRVIPGLKELIELLVSDDEEKYQRTAARLMIVLNDSRLEEAIEKAKERADG